MIESWLRCRARLAAEEGALLMAIRPLSIAASGAQAARIALDVTAQNIANAASSEGYVRRSVRLRKSPPSGGIGPHRRPLAVGRAA
jgi:flagellar hook-associated protein FlgK